MGESEGDAERDEVILHSDPTASKYRKLVIRQNRLVGAILLGECGGLDTLRRAFRSGEPLPDKQFEQLAAS
jgi:NAD(P)H-nitrite reductase large subunit